MLGVAGYWALRLAWAEHLSASPGLEDRRRAVLLAPLDATLYGRLAEKLEETGGDSLPSLEAAAAVDPDNAQWGMSLGQQAELAGDFPLAERSLLAAARLSRLYEPRYLLAGYYFRRGNADLCIRWSIAALAIAPGDATPVLSLMRRLLDPQALAAEGLGQPARVSRQFMVFLAGREEWAAAMIVARHLAQTGADESLPTLLDYINQLLTSGHGTEAVELWNTLCTRHQLPYEPLNPEGGRTLTNADFQHLPSGTGFDWHAESPPGVLSIRLDGALRVDFSGEQTDDCVLFWQYVPLEPGARYRLKQDVHAEDSASASGFRWRLFYPRSAAEWIPLDTDLIQAFRAPAGLARLVLTYRRASGTTRFAGELSVTGLHLDREQ